MNATTWANMILPWSKLLPATTVSEWGTTRVPSRAAQQMAVIRVDFPLPLATDRPASPSVENEPRMNRFFH